MYTINNSGVRGFCSTMGVFMVFDQWWTRKHIYISSLQACYLFYMYGWNVAGQTQALNQYVRLDLGSPIKQNVQLTRIRNTHTNKQTPNQPTKQPYIKHEWSPQSSQGEQSVLRRQWHLASWRTYLLIHQCFLFIYFPQDECMWNLFFQYGGKCSHDVNHCSAYMGPKTGAT